MTNQSQPKPDDHAGVKFPPPIMALILVLAGLGLNFYLSGDFGALKKGLFFSGLGLVIASAGVFVWSAATFRRFKTSILPHAPSDTLMEAGPFVYSRNPIYLAFLLVVAGICLLSNAPYGLVAVPLLWAWLRFYVIAKEESYLTRRFGAPYTDYTARVRRWI